MKLHYSPVKQLRSEAEHVKHSEELVARGIVENQKLSFALPQKTPAQVRLEADAEEVKELEKQLQRLKDEEMRWIEDLKADAEEEVTKLKKSSSTRKISVKHGKKHQPPNMSAPTLPNQANDLDATKNLVSCPQCCGEMIQAKEIELHLKSCRARVVICPEVGCGERILFCDIKEHKRNTCKIALRREKLLEQKKIRDSEEAAKKGLAEKAKDLTPRELLEDRINTGMVKNARARWLMAEEQKMMRGEDHRTMKRENEADLFDIFDVDPNVGERAEKARLRHQEVACPNCGEPVVAMWLTKHINTTCPNRKVPCRNWELGCPAMIRLRDRATHETVEHLLKPRPCLRWTGNAGYVELGEEEDIKPPWTAEFFVYRSSAYECAINITRKALEASKKKDELSEVAEKSMKTLLKGEQVRSSDP